MEHNRNRGEDPRERVNAALATLEQGIDGILESQSFGDYLATMARFHQYSAGNILFICTTSSPRSTAYASRSTLLRRPGRQ